MRYNEKNLNNNEKVSGEHFMLRPWTFKILRTERDEYSQSTTHI